MARLVTKTDEKTVVWNRQMAEHLVEMIENQKYIGIELNPEYIKMAEKRIEQELMQLKLDL